MATNFNVIIPAAGIGSRMGHQIPKQYIQFNNKTILEYTIRAFTAFNPNQVVVAVQKEHVIDVKAIAKSIKMPIKVIVGGKLRRESVKNALVVVMMLIIH